MNPCIAINIGGPKFSEFMPLIEANCRMIVGVNAKAEIGSGSSVSRCFVDQVVENLTGISLVFRDSRGIATEPLFDCHPRY
jgi:hypothetical protein